MTRNAILSQMVRKFNSRVQLDALDHEAIMALPFVPRTYETPAYILREGEPAKSICSFVTSGLAFRQRITVTGARQIVSIHMAGDFLDLQHLFLKRADHSIQALTRLETAEVERDALQELVLKRPNVGRAMWVDALVDASIFREWIVNVGRRDAKARIAHLFCEFALRMKSAGMAQDDHFELPMTQEQLGDATGLTSVHVNRMLKSLADEGLIQRNNRHITFQDWRKISAVGDFSALYLHLDQAGSID